MLRNPPAGSIFWISGKLNFLVRVEASSLGFIFNSLATLKSGTARSAPVLEWASITSKFCVKLNIFCNWEFNSFLRISKK